MKTQEQKLQHVVEAAGDCWHEFVADSAYQKDGDSKLYFKCPKCGDSVTMQQVCNPSPDDFKELVRLAEKLLGLDCRIEFSMHYGGVQAVQMCKENKVVAQGQGETKVDAFLSALFINTGGRE